MSALPTVGDDVVLTVGDRESLLTRVVGMVPNRLDLDLLQAPRTPRSQMERLALYIEFLNEDGYARLHGRCAAVRDDAYAYSGSPGLGFAHKGRPQLMQRRDQLRAATARTLRADLVAPGPPVAVLARTVDVGGSGMTVRGLPAPRIGDEWRFALDMPDGTVLNGRFAVEATARDTASVQFTALARQDRGRMMALAVQALRERRGTV